MATNAERQKAYRQRHAVVRAGLLGLAPLVSDSDRLDLGFGGFGGFPQQAALVRVVHEALLGLAAEQLLLKPGDALLESERSNEDRSPFPY